MDNYKLIDRFYQYHSGRGNVFYLLWGLLRMETRLSLLTWGLESPDRTTKNEILRERESSLTILHQIISIGSNQFDLLMTGSGARLLIAVPLPISGKKKSMQT